ncbi:MAG: FAD-dependent oxidoreductase [Candidatus Methanoperedens sp.]|nr:FAD-dependent oxidoreductase [Candidatus Methanoperedens sp.]
MSFESLSSGKRIVVIGGVGAGLSAASKARKLRSDIEILVFEKSGHISYGACGLPYLISDLIKSPEDLVSHDSKFFKEERDINVFLFHEVVAIYPAKQSVLVKNLQTGAENEYQYDKLVITTGARIFVPQIKGIEIKGIFTIKTLQDGIEIKDFIRKNVPKRALIVGAGHIGLEIAEALIIAGMDVTIVARGPDILGTMDEEITKIVEEGLVRNNVMLLKSTSVREFISKNGYVRKAILENSESINADIVIVCSGMRPNSEIAKEAGIEIDHTGAINVNQRMETNVPGIYSAGDCAMAYHQILKRQVYIPLGTTAIKQGKVAGENMVGGNASFKGIVGTDILKVFDLEVARTGLSGIDAQIEGFNFISNVVEQSSRAHYYPGGCKIRIKLIAEVNTGRILGAEMVGKEGISKRIDVFATAIAAKMTVEDIGDLDLSYAPPFAPVWDPILIAANDLKKKINEVK